MAVNPATVMAALEAAQTAYTVGAKYGPKVRRLANHVVSSGAPKSALKYMSKLRTKKGFSRFVRKDLRKGVKHVSRQIADGRALQKIQSAASGASHAAAVAGDVMSAAGLDPGVAQEIGSIAERGGERATHYHQQVEHLNKSVINAIEAHKRAFYKE